jgi:amidase
VGFDFATNYQNALRRQAAWQQALDQTFKKVDFIALPTLQKLPPRIPIEVLFEMQMLNLQNTVAVNFAGNPALAMPIPLNDKMLPATGLQLVGRRLSEADLLNAGSLVEARSRPDRLIMSAIARKDSKNGSPKAVTRFSNGSGMSAKFARN